MQVCLWDLKVYVAFAELATAEMRIGAAVEVEIITSRKSQALSVPLACIRFEGPAESQSPSSSRCNPLMPYGRDRRPRRMGAPPDQVHAQQLHRYVWTVDHGIARQREVVTGEINENFVQIVSGLDEGETVVVSSEEELAEGMRLPGRLE